MSKKRLGRGNSSKVGNTCGRGTKGQKSRSGYSRKKYFIGGQTPYNILFPKWGFKKKKKTQIVNNKLFKKSLYSNINKILINNCMFKKTFFLNSYSSQEFKKKVYQLGGYI
ncbi:50S ribosomal protein L15 [Candidatus Vidania fulgoroideorum]